MHRRSYAMAPQRLYGCETLERRDSGSKGICGDLELAHCFLRTDGYVYSCLIRLWYFAAIMAARLQAQAVNWLLGTTIDE